MWRSRAGRALIALPLCAADLLAAAPASAMPAAIHISGTAGQGVYIRPAPDTSRPPTGWMPGGASPDYSCFTYGEAVGNVSVWFRISYIGIAGYYASFFDDSSYRTEAELTSKYGVPKCGVQTPAPLATSPGRAPGAGSSSAARFDRTATRTWARRHARDKPTNNVSCTWFISQALWQGGLARTAAWTSDGTHKSRIRRLPGSRTAWVTPDFVRYIRSTYPRSTYTQLSLTRGRTDVTQARIGDVIVYDWDGDSSTTNVDELDHAALVSGFAANNARYPVVSEWSADGGRALTYVDRGWTWSQLSETWLQATTNNHVQAFLLHIDTGD